MAAPVPEGGTAERTVQHRFSFEAERRTVDRNWSRYVRKLNFVLPAMAAMIVILVFAWPQLQLRDQIADPDSLRIRPQDTVDLTVHGVRFVGIDARDRQFTVTAASTRQTHAGADQVALDRPEADMTLSDGHLVALRADAGIFDRDRSALDLSGSVRFFHDDGYELATDRASIDFRGGEAHGEGPVAAHGPAGRARAEGFRVLDNGRTVFFTGRTTLEIEPKAREEGL
ncbi:MAG: LPS export ABC transporter periplasmic protein LptC [Alphaproteobacteria bacterium]